MKIKLYCAVVWGLALALSDAAQAAEEKPATEAAAPAGQTKSKLWSYQPVKAPAVPDVQQKDWVRTPIDAFVLAPLEAKGIKPSQDTDRASFIRRATLDVWGVIPTPEEVDAFVNDKSADAYEKLADRLLASPKYGERQGRKWLDLARYADSTGFQNDNDRLNMWRYRDYVINSFNQDKSYSKFIQEQLAGDELWPGDEQALVATGFMAQFPDNSNSRDLVQRKYQITTDITDTVGKVVLGQTVECARCHNHKFDKISQKDYFSLQSFFANVAPVDNIPAKKGEVEKAYEQQYAKWEEATKDIRAKKKAIIDTHREEALKYHKERYLTDSREAIFKPKEQWNARDRWVNHRLANVTDEGSMESYFREKGESTDAKTRDPKIAEQWAELEKLDKELKKFNDLKPTTSSNTISAMTELGHPDAPPSYVFAVGDHEKPLEEVQPAFPEAITDEKPDIKPLPFSSGRRTALAKWITSPTNPLTARVYTNRIWDQYFGKGIVTTVSDFGKAGQKPTHPELLDYLASKFVNDGWSVKQLHREILLSSVYSQSSDYREDVAQADGENQLLAVFPRQRLEAEQVRDSLLAAAGKLEEKVGGPSVYPPLPKAINTASGNFQGDPAWKTSKDVHDQNRRSLYIFTRRSIPYPILDSFNMASPQEAHSKREVTTTPLQALTLYNSELIFDWSKSLAGRVINEAGEDEEDRIGRLYQILFARQPNDNEKESLQAFLNEQEAIIRAKAADGKFEVNVPAGVKDKPLGDPVRAAAFVDLVHVVANSNEFIYRF
ncbi:protein of unknown function DUF1549 [Methylomonas albis]|uniref:DUF1553 domain-containing protein n=1 Tax=Methylomonas albis TaxID=1854563 RepID=A0ABR9D0C3_9GAMM|nr:DUF1549 and DUF1553 domain-containing protein [Methylomonas albis]MBD9356579.1 DUF1553 domain-containing protein [Methylomonas albis]CAD6879703.1 protein of unknown function DUF1549 [Methylomonas albis]